ncbi:MAG: GNAT family N-acetyltransferase, partial [Asticcacaulis sp.]
MSDPAGPYHVKVHPSLHEIPAADWDALAGSDHPFTRHAYLVALEETGCATARTGWAAAHIGVYDTLGQLCGALPLYLKSHSYGEYVFDHAWAEAYERAGGRYYPKLQASVPFTPVTGPRLMARDPMARKAILEAALGLLPRTRASSLHLTFPTHEDWQWLGEHGFLLRQDRQFWWQNAGYSDFESFLAALSSGRRKTIRRERRDAQAAAEIVVREGPDLSATEWDAFYHFYLDTGARKWGQPYLNRAFFDQISRTLSDQIVMMLARRDGDWVAGAINFKSRDTLYGRQWGAIETIPF